MRTAAGVWGVVELPGTEISVPVARAYVRELLSAVGYQEVDEVELLVSELVANAARHSDSRRRPGGQITVAVATAGDLVHVDVIDEGSETPMPDFPTRVDDLDEGGRGLWLVRALSSACGWEDDATGRRTVWFEWSACDQRQR